MREVSSEEFARSPVGRYAASDTWLCFCADASLVAAVLWGRIDEHRLHGLCAALPETAPSALPPHAFVLDVRNVESLDPWLLPNFKRYFETNHATIERAVTRLAVVRPEGLLGAAVAEGFFNIVPAPCPVQTFVRPEAAFEWLGAAPVARALADAVATVRASSRLSARVRALFAQAGARAPIHAVARQLGLSSRTLQRRLQLEGTSFRDEVNFARLCAAQRMLCESEASISAIAFEVGYASPAHLSEQFRRRMGESPSQWREKRRSTPPPSGLF